MAVKLTSAVNMNNKSVPGAKKKFLSTFNKRSVSQNRLTQDCCKDMTISDRIRGGNNYLLQTNAKSITCEPSYTSC